MSILKPIGAECLRKWTRLAVKCYRSGCNCANCHILDGCETINPTNCRMKAVVLGLVRKFGKPTEENTYFNLKKEEESWKK